MREIGMSHHLSRQRREKCGRQGQQRDVPWELGNPHLLAQPELNEPSRRVQCRSGLRTTHPYCPLTPAVSHVLYITHPPWYVSLPRYFPSDRGGLLRGPVSPESPSPHSRLPPGASPLRPPSKLRTQSDTRARGMGGE